jgi:diguanylate cyclase (GGDEF)-like protein/PAS domain S-box-containing protein
MVLKTWHERLLNAGNEVDLLASTAFPRGHRRLLVLFLVLLLLVPGLGFLIVQYELPDVEKRTYNKLQAIAELKAAQVRNWLSERHSDGQSLAGDPGFIDMLVAVSQGDRAKADILGNRIDAFRTAYGYLTVTLFDADRKVLIQSGEPHDVGEFTSGAPPMSLPAEQSTGVALFRDTEGRIHIDYVLLLGGAGKSTGPAGSLIIHADPEAFLFPYLQDWPADNTSGETLLARRHGDRVVLLNRQGQASAQALTMHRSVNSPKLPAAIAVKQGGAGMVEGIDYRGVRVLAAYQQVADTDWTIIAKLDRSEVLGPLYRLVNWVMLISLFALGAIGVAMIAMWRQQQRMYTLALQAEKSKTERALRNFYRLPFIGMAIISPESRHWLQFNDRLCAILGYNADELREKTWPELTHPDDLETDLAELTRIAAGETDGYSIDKRFIRKDGSVIYASIDVRAIRKANGRVDYFVATVQDITRRKLAEQALMSSETRLRTLVQTIPDLIWLKNVQGEFLACNSMFERFFGTSEAEIIGKTDYDFVDKELGDFFRAHDRRAMQAGKPSTNEEWLTFRADGYHGLFETIKTPMYDPDGELIGVLGIARDISARKRLEEERHESLERLEKISGQIPGMVYQYRLYGDGRHCIPYASDAIKDIFSVTPDQVREDASIAFDKMHEDDIDQLVESIQRSALQLTPWQYEFRVNNADASVRWLYANALPQRQPDGSTLWHGFIMDIGERKSSEAKIRLAAEVFEQSREGIVITDVEQNIVMVNRAFTWITGYSESEVLGRNPSMLSSGHHDKAFFDEMWSTIHKQGYWHGEIWNRKKDGSVFPQWLHITRTLDDRGELTGYVGISEDISQRKAYEEHIQWLANFDVLTELPNRTLLVDRSTHVMRMAQRNNSHVSILYCDLDLFKNINDVLGHSVGDRLLVAIARRMSSVLRAEDTVSRYGGDEFILLLPDTSAEGAANVAEKILESISEPYDIDGMELSITLSMGIAVYPQDGKDFETLIKHGDIAMYRAKKIGRNNYCFYTSELQEISAHTLQLENDIQYALSRNELLLFYQPQVSLTDGKIIGVEALLRWQHPKFGLVPPMDFIPLAENSGQILHIGEWVLRTAMGQLRSWIDNGMEPIKIAVNLSVRQLRQPRLFDMLTSVVEEFGIDHQFLELELTESMLMEDQENIIATLYRISEYGIQLAIDDFGTGYSSLSYLRRLPVDYLKIDKAFTQDMLNNAGDAIIARSIITLGHSLGLKVIAEGVETGAQLDFLRAHHCDHMQGFLFSKPLPVEEVTAMLENSQSMSLLPELYQSAESNTLLLVDDEKNVLNALKRTLRHDGYEILTAESGRQGLVILAMNEVSVIISDQRMPDMSGVEFLSKAKELYPDTVRIVLSGYTDLKSITDAINRGDIYRFLTKPWDDEMLRASIREAFQHYKLAIDNRRLALELREANKALARYSRQDTNH